MKATIRVPMRESFAYIEFELDMGMDATSVENVFKLYKQALALSKEGSDNDF